MKYFILGLKNWNKFNGRANRSEFWYFTLFYFIFGAIAYFIDVSFLGYDLMDITSIGVLQTAYNLVLLIPSFSVTIRRLHDINKSGWNLLWMLIPLLGAIYIIILNILKGTDGDNKYGAPSNAQPTYDMKKLPNWVKLIIAVVGLAVGYKFGYAIMDWLLDLLNF